ncbi:MAG: hypothetical protein U0Q07_02295 [Acidimicrobiales bacterium]
MLSPTLTTLRLFLHVLGATVWVGGQIVLAGLVPTVRKVDPEAPRLVARQFNKIAWAGFALLVVTGVWNLFAIDVGDTSLRYQVTLMVKLTAVAATAIGAVLHTIAKSKVGLAVWGAVSLVGALAALLLGIVLQSGG